jgi:type VI secretion system secreted protein Hcp
MAHNVFIKCAAWNGGSTSKGHEAEIEVASWSHGFDQPTSPIRSAAGGGTYEKAHHHHFTFTKQLDSSTDDILKSLWTGAHIDKVLLTCYRAAGDTGANQIGVPYLKVEMESVIVTAFAISGGDGGFVNETVSLNYAKVTYTYTNQDKTSGKVGAAQPVSHDLRTNVVA